MSSSMVILDVFQQELFLSHWTFAGSLVTITNDYARAYGVPLPAVVPGHRNYLIVLPSDEIMVFVFSGYKEACSKNLH